MRRATGNTLQVSVGSSEHVWEDHVTSGDVTERVGFVATKSCARSFCKCVCVCVCVCVCLSLSHTRTHPPHTHTHTYTQWPINNRMSRTHTSHTHTTHTHTSRTLLFTRAKNSYIRGRVRFHERTERRHGVFVWVANKRTRLK